MKNIFILTTVFLGLGAQTVYAQSAYAQADQSQPIATGESHPELLAEAEQPALAMHKPSPATAADDTIVSDAHAPVLLPNNATDMEAVGVPAPVAVPSTVPAALPATAPAVVESTGYTASANDDPDYGIVTRVPHREGELAEGTMLRTHLNQAISTSYTTRGTTFSARLVADVMQDGHVIVPIGSTVLGKVTMVEERRRVQGRAKLRLRADEVVLPDGSKMLIHAQVVDTSDYSHTKTDHEGTIISRDDAKKNWIIAGTTTGTGAVSGAIIGGPVGAVVGTAIGAGVGAGHFMMAHPVAALPQSSTLVFQLTEPMAIVPTNE